MTDVFLAFAREDRERVRVLSDMLRFEGWDVWMEPSNGAGDQRTTDAKLGSASAILAVWSDRARASEQVRSEAVTGLYKNKLIQIRLDGGAPPRPFDQLEVMDFAHWSGQADDPNWRRLGMALRRSVGEPAGTRPLIPPQQPARGQAAAPPPPRAASFSVPPAQPVFQPPPAPPPYTPPPELTLSAPPPQPAFKAPPQPAFPSLSQQPAYTMAKQTYVPQPVAPQPVYTPQQAYAPQPQPYGRQPVYEPPQSYAPPPRSQPLSAPVSAPLSPPISLSPHSQLSSSGYGEPRRAVVWAPILAAGVLIASGVGLWTVDPFGWRGSGNGESEADPIAMAARTVPDAKVANGEPATGVFEDTAESAAEWSRVNRKSPEGLRDYITEFPRASTAETARSMIRVLDAQAWVQAVTADNEGGYRAYLKRFPESGEMPGAMAAAAADRLSALGGERLQAIEEIQRGLAALNIYEGDIDGRGGDTTTRAVKLFASQTKRTAPALATAAPRDLRAFAEAVRGAGSRPVSSSAVAAAIEADRMRVEQAQAASLAAAQAASVAPPPNADALAKSQQDHIAETTAWDQSSRAGTQAAYQAYLAAWPSGSHADEARAAMTRLNRAAPYTIDQLPAEVRTAVDSARRAQAAATQKAAAARQAATAAESLVDARSIIGAGGDKYDAQISNGAPNGLGIRTRGAGVNVGDRYRGELRNGLAAGVGVYEFADNAGNANARAARYEGEYAGDAPSGAGITYWRSGENFAGVTGKGVLTYANGQRYEGEMLNGERNGFGVVWAADGSVSQSGRWSRDQLADAMKAGQ